VSFGVHDDPDFEPPPLDGLHLADELLPFADRVWWRYLASVIELDDCEIGGDDLYTMALEDEHRRHLAALVAGQPPSNGGAGG
jgi:hypothetical protein